MNISETILYIVDRHLTAVAKGAGREVKILQPLSQVPIPLLVPDLQQVILVNIANEILSGCALAVSQIMFVCVKQRQAGTDFSIPANRQATALDKWALINISIQKTSGKFELV